MQVIREMERWMDDVPDKKWARDVQGYAALTMNDYLSYLIIFKVQGLYSPSRGTG